MKLRKADIEFSKYLRKKIGKCTRCGSPVKFNDKGNPISHQASHFHGRRKESVRFDEVNVTVHCGGCHRYLTANPEEHRAWKLQQLGQKDYDLLTLRANLPGKKDDNAILLWLKAVDKS